MTFFLLPLLLITLLAIILKGLVPVGLRVCGKRDGSVPALEDRLGGILFLLCADIMVSIAFWYPLYVCKYHAAPDDRYGYAIMFGIPFWVAGVGITVWALYGLLRAVFRRPRTTGNIVYAVSGSLLAAVGFSPLFMLAHRLITLRQS